MAGRTPSWVYLSVNTIFWIILTALAAASMWPIYLGNRFILLVAVTTLVGSAIALLGAIFRYSSFTVLLAMAGVYFLLGVPLAIPGQAILGFLPSLSGLTDLAGAIALSWKQLVTIDLPVGSYQSLLVPAFILVLVCSTVGLSIALRARRGEYAVLLPAAVFVIGNLLGSSTVAMPPILGVSLLATGLLWLGWRSWYRRAQSVRRLSEAGQFTLTSKAESRWLNARAFVSTVVILGIGTAIGLTTVHFVPPSTNRDVIRSSIQQPFNPGDYSSPLAGFRYYLQPDQANEDMLKVSGLPEGARIRLATLDSYDGVVFRVGTNAERGTSGDFTRVASTVDQSGVAGVPVKVRVDIEGYAGIWLPTVGKTSIVDFAGSNAQSLQNAYFYNDYSGTAVLSSGAKTGVSYSLTAVIPSDDTPISDLKPGTAPLITTGTPAELTSTLAKWVDPSESQGKQLQAMLTALATTGYISHGIGKDEPASRSGHSESRIAELFTSTPMIGDAEQYSVAAALMAAQIGFPSRVVMGFVPQGSSTQLTGSDITAWIEVQTTTGWRAIDPVPAVRKIPEDQVQEPTVVPRPRPVVLPPVEQETPHEDPTPADTARETPQESQDPVLAAILAVLSVTGWTVLVLMILLSPFLTVVAAKWQRRKRRRTTGNAREKINGAWQEYEDAALDFGYSPAPAATRLQMASAFGAPAAVALAESADRAVFAPEDVSDAQVAEVWDASMGLRTDLSKSRTRWQRIRARISLRSLGGYHVTSLFRRDRK